MSAAQDLSSHSVAELLDLFVSITREIEDAGHVGRRNRLHAVRRRVVDTIKVKTDGSARALFPLIAHDDPQIRQNAAFFYGEVDPEPYLGILRELALRKDKIGRDAAASLEWRKTHPFTGPATLPDHVPSPRDSRLSGHAAPVGMSPEQLEPLLFDAFPRETAKSLLALARPAIRVWPQPSALASDTGSRFGGLPMVPTNWRWPTTEVWPKAAGLDFLMKSRDERGPMPREPKWFLGQINCADLQGLAAAAELLPSSGVFSFFADSDLVTGCIGPWDCGGLYFFSAGDIELAAEPVEDFKRLPTCGLAFSDAIDLPDPFSRAIKNLALDKSLRDRYCDIRQLVSKHGVEVERYDTLDHSKLFGWPDLIQRDLEAFSDEVDADARLFLQIGNYDNGNESWYWGPGGLVYFALSGKAFNEGDCGACCCEMQCT